MPWGINDPTQMRIDPLNNRGRGLLDSVQGGFQNYLREGQPPPRGMLADGQGSIFDQLYGGKLPGVNPMERRGPAGPTDRGGGIPNINTQPMAVSPSRTMNAFGGVDPNVQPPAFDPLGMSNTQGGNSGFTNTGTAGPSVHPSAFDQLGFSNTQGGSTGFTNTGLPAFQGGDTSVTQFQTGDQEPATGWEKMGDAARRAIAAEGAASGRGAYPRNPPADVNMFDAPMWQGPYAAPLTQGQMDALSGFQNILGGQGNPLVPDEMIQGALDRNLNGNPSFDPSQGSLEDAVSPYELPTRTGGIFDRIFNSEGDGSGATGGSRLNDVLEQIQPELVDSFKTALQPAGAGTGQGQAAFDQAINYALAQAGEQASSYGLSPGSVDRGQLMAGQAGQVAAELGLGQQSADTNTISRQNQDRIGAINSAGQFGNLLNKGFENTLARDRTSIAALDPLLRQEDSAFNRMMQVNEPAAARSLEAMRMLPGFRDIPLQELERMFGMGEAARGVADSAITRNMGEFGRTQFGTLDRILQSIQPGQMDTAMGPSPLSQVAPLASALIK